MKVLLVWRDGGKWSTVRFAIFESNFEATRDCNVCFVRVRARERWEREKGDKRGLRRNRVRDRVGVDIGGRWWGGAAW